MSETSSLQRFTALAKDFSKNSHEILPSQWSRYQQLITLVLVILSFASVASALLNKNSSAVKYFSSAIVASFSIGLSSVYVCNFFAKVNKRSETRISATRKYSHPLRPLREQEIRLVELRE